MRRGNFRMPSGYRGGFLLVMATGALFLALHATCDAAPAGVLEGTDTSRVEAVRTVFPGPGWAGVVRISILLTFLAMVFAAARMAVRSGMTMALAPGRLWVLAGLTVLAAGLRFTLSPHEFLNQGFHHGTFVHQLLHAPGVQWDHGEVGPAFYRLFDLLLGGGERTVFAVNAVLGSLTVPAVVLLGLALYRNWSLAWFSGLILALFPLHLRFSASEDPIVAATLFGVASAAFSLAWVDTRRPAALVGAVAACALAMQSRTELMVWPVLLVGLLLLARGRRVLASLRRPEFLVAAGVLILLVAPRLEQVLSPPDGHIQGQMDPGSFAGHLNGLLNPFHERLRQVFFRQDVTPPFLWALALGGVAWAMRSARGPLAASFLVILGYVSLTTVFHGNMPFLLRTQVFISPWWALVAAGTLPWWLGALEPDHRLRRWAVCLVAVLATLSGILTHGSWVSRSTEAWQEFHFIREQVPLLPRDARILTIVQPTYPDLDSFPGFLLDRHGRTDVTLIDLRDVLDGRVSWPSPGPDLLFLQGMFCHFVMPQVDPPPGELAARCLAVRDRYVLEPRATALLDGVPSSEMVYLKDGVGPWEVGLFQVVDWREP